MSDRKTKNPNSTVEKLKAQKAKINEIEALGAEGAEEFKRALNSIAASPNGKIVFKTLIKALGVHSPERGSDLAELIRISERKNVYNELIRPNLEPRIRQEIEN